VIAQHGQQHLVGPPFLGRLPVDVEVARVAAGGPVLEDVPPPGVLPAGDRHVVRHHVDHCGRGPRPAAPRTSHGVRLGAAELRRSPGSGRRCRSRASLPARRLQVGRGVEVADPQLGQVGERGRLLEPETGAQLQSIGRPRDRPHGLRPPAGAPRARGPAGAPSCAGAPRASRRDRIWPEHAFGFMPFIIAPRRPGRVFTRQSAAASGAA
jgi:hypothetical protein